MPPVEEPSQAIAADETDDGEQGGELAVVLGRYPRRNEHWNVVFAARLPQELVNPLRKEMAFVQLTQLSASTQTPLFIFA